jgi:hypothetical protein
MRNVALMMIFLAVGIPVACVAQTQEPPKQSPPIKITSLDDLKKLTSQISGLIAPFTLDDLRNGFKNEPSLADSPSGVVIKKGSGTREDRSVTKPRPSGGKISVDVLLLDGEITAVIFKHLPEGGGFQAMWDAKPVLILSKRTTVNTNDDIGFSVVKILQGDQTTDYELP